MFGILVFGDSIVHGRGESPSIGWVGRLKTLFESKDPYHALYNLGVPGENSTTLLKRFEHEASARINHLREGDRFVVMISIGVNDTKAIENEDNVVNSLEEYKKNLLALLELSRKYTQEVFLLNILPVDEDLVQPYENTYFSNQRIDKYNQEINNIANQYNLPLLDVHNFFFNQNYKELLSDGLHPNSVGYDVLAKFINQELEKRSFF